MQQKIPLSQQIAELTRELDVRRRTYPSQVMAGKIRRGEADHCTAAMQAAQETLLWLQQHERVVRDAIAKSRQ